MEIDHRKLGVTLFNATWDFIDKETRTEEEIFEMIDSAHASAYHWSKFEGVTPANFARSCWQISRVYCLANQGDAALLYANRSLEICLQNDLGALDLAFGYESVARAYAVKNMAEARDNNIALAREAAEKITDNEDKNWTLQNINNIK